MPDLYKEEQLRRELNMLSFNKLPAEAMVKFVEETSKQSEAMKQSAKEYRKSAKKALSLMVSKSIIHKMDLTKTDLSEYAKTLTDAVDGSLQKYPRPDGGWMIFYSVARIRYPQGYDSDVDVLVTPAIRTINQIDEKGAGAAAEKFMMDMETEALKVTAMSRKKESDGIIFLDGPIIDPPFENQKQYVEGRTFAIKQGFSRGAQLIGIVKRISGTLFSNHYKSFFPLSESVEFENMLSDKNLAVHIFTEYLKNDKDCLAYTEPILLSEINSKGKTGEIGKKAANEYQNNGVDVLTFLMANGYVSSPIRVDIALSPSKKFVKNDLVIEAIKSIVRWAAPGRHIPIPVILAHEKCNIGQGAADILFREFITGSKSNEDVENIIQMKMMGDVH